MKKYFLVFLSLICFFGLSAQEKLYENNFSLSDVELLAGPLKDACDLNVSILLEYDADRLLAPFLKQAGLPTKAKSFDNWIDLDGHIGGHYLTALAIHYAATGNQELKNRMDYFLSELKRCQVAHDNGYVGGVPNGEVLWNRIKNRDWGAVWDYWVPWYNIHKTFAGLRDVWAYTGDELAKDMFLDLCDWGLTIIDPLNNDEMEGMLGNEFGGMNEIYADAYQITGEEKYLVAAKRFAHKFLFDSMANEKDNLDNIHANTQVPKAVGYQRVAEVSNDAKSRRAARFFWETVVNNRSLSMGGNSRREHFPSKEDCVSYTEEREGPETCNTNNMLKLSAGLFRMTTDAKYSDYYERAMFNHILSSQHPEHGGYVYFTSARPRHYRVYSAPNMAMWCCVGTGMENHGKYGEFIYTHDDESLFVNLFVASKLNWKEKNVSVTQNTKFPYEEGSRLTINVNNPTKLSIKIRHPWWVSEGEFKIMYNGQNLAVNSTPSSYVEVEKTWQDGDVLTIVTPMKNTIEEMPNVPDYISVLHGPILLAAKTGAESMTGLIADEGRWAHIAAGRLLPITEAPFSIGTREDIQQKLDSMEPIAGKPLHFKASGVFEGDQDQDLVFEPFFGVHDSRYLMYWLAMTQEDYDNYLAEMDAKERERLLLEERTVDMVTPAEQQPEVDHLMETLNSNSGYHNEEGWRDAVNNGWFSYNLLTERRTDLSLMVRYWGNEGGNRRFRILIDDELLTEENVTGKWNRDEFVNVEYQIPLHMLEGKSSIRVKFECLPGNIAGGVFKVRLLKPIETSVISPYKLSPGDISSVKNEIIFSRFLPGSLARIYNASGQLLESFTINRDPYHYTVDQQGVYIVQVSGIKEKTLKVLV